jgi:hypothetical protein
MLQYMHLSPFLFLQQQAVDSGIAASLQVGFKSSHSLDKKKNAYAL